MDTHPFPPYGPCGYGAPFGAPGIPGIPGSPGPAGSMGIAEPPGPRGSTGPPGDRGDVRKPGNQGLSGRQGHPGKMGPQGNWKQCVFKTLSEEKDTGLIKECLFIKKSAKTALRVFWSGNLRLYNCHGVLSSCCN
ncbi:unnamed protein product [Pocillopora meandrina]|uniref:CTHRC1 C-terminal domain-containing protein n=1 Tax=Pocillopora meandrina TaxID=46732 RepID=A0AAU9VY15_9CNID|nr:unnamed protein product [Pocillopora meandrina]